MAGRLPTAFESATRSRVREQQPSPSVELHSGTVRLAWALEEWTPPGPGPFLSRRRIRARPTARRSRRRSAASAPSVRPPPTQVIERILEDLLTIARLERHRQGLVAR